MKYGPKKGHLPPDPQTSPSQKCAAASTVIQITDISSSNFTNVVFAFPNAQCKQTHKHTL